MLSQGESNHKYESSHDYEQINVNINGKILIKHLVFTIWSLLAAAQILSRLKSHQSYTVTYIVCY